MSETNNGLKDNSDDLEELTEYERNLVIACHEFVKTENQKNKTEFARWTFKEYPTIAKRKTILLFGTFSIRTIISWISKGINNHIELTEKLDQILEDYVEQNFKDECHAFLQTENKKTRSMFIKWLVKKYPKTVDKTLMQLFGTTNESTMRNWLIDSSTKKKYADEIGTIIKKYLENNIIQACKSFVKTDGDKTKYVFAKWAIKQYPKTVNKTLMQLFGTNNLQTLYGWMAIDKYMKKDIAKKVDDILELAKSQETETEKNINETKQITKKDIKKTQTENPKKIKTSKPPESKKTIGTKTNKIKKENTSHGELTEFERRRLTIMEKELILKARELDIREREIILKARELDIRKQELILKARELDIRKRELILKARELEEKLGLPQKQDNENNQEEIIEKDDRKSSFYEEITNIEPEIDESSKHIEENLFIEILETDKNKLQKFADLYNINLLEENEDQIENSAKLVEQYKHYSKIKQDQFISRLLVEISVGTAPKPFAVFIFYRLTQMGLNKTCLNNQPSITKNNSLTKLERSFFLTKINELQLNFNEFNINETFLADYSDYWKVFRNEMGKMHTKYINKIGKHNENDNLNRKEFLYLLTELTKQILIGNTEHSQFNIGKKNTFEKPKDNQEYVNITPKKVKIGQ